MVTILFCVFVAETEQKFRSVFIACQRSRLLCVLIVDSSTLYIYRVPVPELDFAERIGSCQLLGREFASSELSIGTIYILRTLAPKNLAPISLAVLDQKGVLRDVEDDEGKCINNMKIIRLRSQNLQDRAYTVKISSKTNSLGTINSKI